MRRFLPLLALLPLALAQDGGPAASRLDETNRKAAEKVVRTVAKQGKLLTTQLKGLRKEDVIVVGGLFDFVQELLTAFRAPHTVIRPDELEHVAMEKPERMIFFLNCHLCDRQFPDSQPPRPAPDAAEAARRLEAALKEAGLDGDGAPGKAIRERFAEMKFFAGSDYSVAGLKRMADAVRKGAWVFSTDWALLALERAFPKTIQWTGRSTYEETVEVKPSLVGKRHPLLAGVFEKKKARWWLETESYLFRVHGKHKTLVESLALGARYGGNRRVVTLLEPGKGRVLHALSHTYLQKGRTDDAVVMQRLLVNFLIAKSLENHERAYKEPD